MVYHFKKIDHVQLAAPVGEENKARAFYNKLLGFIEIEKPESLKQNGGVWFQSGSVHIHIGIEENFTPAKKAHPAIEVEELEAFQAYLESKDVHVTVDARLPHAHRFYIHDPFGNRLEFLEWE